MNQSEWCIKRACSAEITEETERAYWMVMAVEWYYVEDGGQQSLQAMHPNSQLGWYRMAMRHMKEHPGTDPLSSMLLTDKE